MPDNKPDSIEEILEGKRPPTLEDLTKEELIELYRKARFSPPEREIAFILWSRTQMQAGRAMAKATQDQINCTKNGSHENRLGFLKAADDFDRAMALSKRADQFWEKYKR